jgi:hypothetical protein
VVGGQVLGCAAVHAPGMGCDDLVPQAIVVAAWANPLRHFADDVLNRGVTPVSPGGVIHPPESYDPPRGRPVQLHPGALVFPSAACLETRWRGSA